MTLSLPSSLFIEIWKFHFSFFWKADIKMLVIRLGKRPFPGKFIRISTADPAEAVQKKALALTTLAHKIQHLPQDVRRRFHGMTQEEQMMAVQKYEQEMEPKLMEEIQAFVIKERKKGTDVRKIKKLVRRKFKVKII